MRDEAGDALRAWLASTPEEAIDPEQPIIDAHHHLWDRRPRPPMKPGERVQHRYLLDDLMEDIRGGGHNVIDTVFVECQSMYREDRSDPHHVVGETEFVQGVAAMAASGLCAAEYGPGVRCCGAIVGAADLTLDPGLVDSVLRAHMAASQGFRGVRHGHGWHPSPGVHGSHAPTRGRAQLLAADDYRAGLAVLMRLGLSLDCWGYFTQLDDVADMAAAFPDLNIVLNHLGGPITEGPYEGKRESVVFPQWYEAIKRVAECPNVVVKLGGCAMKMYGFGFDTREPGPARSEELAAAWKPTLAHLIELFGPERCMFESNFPVDKVSCSYTGLWNAFKIVSNDLGLSQSEKDSVFFATAARAYAMPLS